MCHGPMWNKETEWSEGADWSTGTEWNGTGAECSERSKQNEGTVGVI